MRLSRAPLGLFLCAASLLCFAQDQLRIVASVPLPQQDARNSGFAWDPTRLGCAKDGTVMISANRGDERVSPLIVKVSASGALLWAVDSENVAGLGKADLDDFAPGVGGELYLLVKRIAHEYSYIDQDGQRVQGGYDDHPGDWLVRYDAEGRFLDKKPIMAAHVIRIAVFPSGDVFMLTYTIQGLPFRQGDAPHIHAVLAGIFSKDGILLHRVNPPDFFLDGSSDRPHTPWPVPLPMLGPDGNVYVVKEGETPALAVISPDGSVLRSVALAVPEGETLDFSRLFGKTLVARMMTDPGSEPGRALKTSIAEFDTESGRMVSNYLTAKTGWWPACDEGSGLTAINPFSNTFDTLEPIPQTKTY
jgi:hypothetical protein